MTPPPRSDADTAGATRVQQQEVVTTLAQQALESDDFDRLLHDVAIAVVDTMGAQYASVFELRAGGDAAVLRQGAGWREGVIGETTITVDANSRVERVLRSADPVVVDFRSDGHARSELLADHDVVSGISVSIGSADDPWGVL